MKTIIDLMREYVRVADMCKGTPLEDRPWECVWLDGGTIMESEDQFQRAILAGCNVKFALAILEGKPVFVGDKLWWSSTNSFISVEDTETFRQVREPFWSWTTSTPKRTFMLNGVELPCPDKNAEQSNYVFQINGERFRFFKKDDYDLVRFAICWMLTEARDKE